MSMLNSWYDYPLSIFLLVIGYATTLAIYRLYLHPLAKFPGPRLAGLTFYYGFYYEVVLKGQYTFHIRELHRKYGPIVRITPEEVHIYDPDFYDELYAKQGRLHRDPRMNPFFGNAMSLVGTDNCELHKIRRAPLASLFSRKRILELQPILKAKLRKLLSRLDQAQISKQPFPLEKAFMALVEDVIFQYCFGECYNRIDVPDFKDNLHTSFCAVVQSGYVAVYLPWVPKLLMSIPPDILVKLQPIFAAMFQVQKDIRKWAVEVQQKSHDPEFKPDHAAVLVELANSDMPASEKTSERIGDEAQNLLGAGVTTTGWAATVTAFHIINNESIFTKLRHELATAFPDANAALDWLKLEKLPYLQACIKEGIRMSTGESTRSPRISDKPIRYKHWTIPPGSIASMSIYDISFDERIFPDPNMFLPERWLDLDSSSTSAKDLEKYFIFFSRGYRSCLGMQLAYAELYLIIGGVFRNYTMRLFETDESHVRMAHDFFIPLPKLDSKGVRVKVVGD